MARYSVSRYTSGTEVGSWAWMISFVVKYCAGCKQTLPIGEYGSSVARSDGLQCYCKPCSCAYNRQWKKNNPERASAMHRASLYGISTQEVNAFLSIPSCQSCGSSFESDHSVKLDHCHCKGHVRGAICHACNMSLMGPADEALRRLDSCRQYLMRDLERQREQG